MRKLRALVNCYCQGGLSYGDFRHACQRLEGKRRFYPAKRRLDFVRWAVHDLCFEVACGEETNEKRLKRRLRYAVDHVVDWESLRRIVWKIKVAA